MDPLLRYAVLALGCRYAETQKSHEDAGAHFFKQCQQILNTTLLSHDNNNSNITLSKLQVNKYFIYIFIVVIDKVSERVSAREREVIKKKCLMHYIQQRKPLYPYSILIYTHTQTHV